MSDMCDKSRKGNTDQFEKFTDEKNACRHEKAAAAQATANAAAAVSSGTANAKMTAHEKSLVTNTLTATS